ncbi:MAG TPA: hypothetical protein VF453_16880 [Burkholderiaceae bacterium]
MSVREGGEDGGTTPGGRPSVPEDDGAGPLPQGGALVPEVLQALRTLREGGHACVPVRGTFPEQFVCVGTADQIRRMFQGGAF